MELPHKFYKLGKKGRLKEGKVLQSKNWELTSSRDGYGFGVGICSNPLDAYNYLMPNSYCEIFEIESFGDLRHITACLWRSNEVLIGRRLGFSEIDSFSNERNIATTNPNIWIHVSDGQVGYTFGEGKIIATGGIVYAYDTSEVYAQRRTVVDAYNDVTVIAIDNSLVYYRDWANVIVEDNAESRCLT